MSRTLFFCDHHEIPLPDGHKFPIRKYRLLREMLAADGQYTFLASAAADLATIKLAHDAEYVDRFVAGTLALQVQRRIGFPWSEQLVRRTLCSAGGTLAAMAEALRTGYGGNLAGGTHHAFFGDGSGFCVFNDIAVGIHAARRDYGVRRAAVVDLDVHQGDGTALMFENDADVLTLSLHGKKNFPFRKQASNIDVELEDGTGDQEYVETLEGVMPRVLEFKPRIVFYQSGVDPLECDLLGRLSLSAAGLIQRDEIVLQACKRSGIPVVVVLGGGYGSPIERTAEAHANTFRVAWRIFEADGVSSQAGIARE